MSQMEMIDTFNGMFADGMKAFGSWQEHAGAWLDAGLTPAAQWWKVLADQNPFMADGNAPEFDSIFGLDKKLSAFTRAATRRSRAEGAYRGLVAKAWADAWTEFLSSQKRLEPGFKQNVDRWLEHANDAMLALQHSDEFLAAQRAWLASLSEYRQCQRELVEAFQEQAHTPTRTEVDDLSRSVYELKREVRALRRELHERGGVFHESAG